MLPWSQSPAPAARPPGATWATAAQTGNSRNTTRTHGARKGAPLGGTYPLEHRQGQTAETPSEVKAGEKSVTKASR